MANEWYIEREDRTAGPFTGTQLKELAASGRLRPDDRIRRGQDGKVAPVSSVKGLFGSDSDSQRKSTPITTTPKRQATGRVLMPPRIALVGAVGCAMLFVAAYSRFPGFGPRALRHVPSNAINDFVADVHSNLEFPLKSMHEEDYARIAAAMETHDPQTVAAGLSGVDPYSLFTDNEFDMMQSPVTGRSRSDESGSFRPPGEYTEHSLPLPMPIAYWSQFDESDAQGWRTTGSGSFLHTFFQDGDSGSRRSQEYKTLWYGESGGVFRIDSIEFKHEDDHETVVHVNGSRISKVTVKMQDTYHWSTVPRTRRVYNSASNMYHLEEYVQEQFNRSPGKKLFTIEYGDDGKHSVADER